MRVEKYTDPSQLDKHPYGTLWRVYESDKQFVQVSDDPERPLWIRVESILGSIAYNCKPSHGVVVRILDLYKRYK